MSEDFGQLNDKELHQKFCSYGTSAKEWMHKCELLLPEIDRRKIWKKRGYGSMYEYAAALAGMSRYRVEQALRAAGKASRFPELRPIIEARGTSAVRPVLGVISLESAAFWAGKAETMSVRALEAYVRATKEQGLIVGGEAVVSVLENATPEKTFQNEAEKRHVPFSEAENFSCSDGEIVMKLPKEIIVRLKKLRGQGEWMDLMHALLKSHEKEIVRDKPVAVVATSRHIPAEIEKYVLRRSGGTCEFPWCMRPHDILHHTQRFYLEAVHDPDRIVALCTAHERVVHLGLVEDETAPTKEWRVVAHADTRDTRYEVDRVVQKYRKPG